VDCPQRIVAVGLLTEYDLSVLGEGFRRVYRLDQGHDFSELLGRIDDAERALCARESPDAEKQNEP
jgi:hypothetical protein